MNPTSPLSLCVTAIVGLSLLGLPIGHAMIGGSVLYLYLAGLDKILPLIDPEELPAAVARSSG